MRPQEGSPCLKGTAAISMHCWRQGEGERAAGRASPAVYSELSHVMGAEKQAVSSACLFPKDRCPSWRRVLVLIFPKPRCVGRACRDQGWRALSVCTAVKCDAGKEAKQLLSCLFNVCESFPCPQPPKLSQHLVNPLLLAVAQTQEKHQDVRAPRLSPLACPCARQLWCLHQHADSSPGRLQKHKHAARPSFNWRHGRETNLCCIKILSTHPSLRPSVGTWCSLPCMSLLPGLSFPLFSSSFAAAHAGTSVRCCLLSGHLSLGWTLPTG